MVRPERTGLQLYVASLRPLSVRDADRAVSPANAISWGALGPQMFGPGSIYHMVPISLAIGVVLPLPFWVAVRPPPRPRRAPFTDMLSSRIAQILAARGLPELQHLDHHAVLVLPLRRHQHLREPRHGDRNLLAVVGAHALPALVHEVQVRAVGCFCPRMRS